MNKINNKVAKELVKINKEVEVYKYVNDKGLFIYDFKEYPIINIGIIRKYGCFFEMNDELKTIKKYGKEYEELKMMHNYGLFKIEDNYSVLVNNKKIQPFMIYEFFPFDKDLMITSWTKNPNEKFLTGNQSLCYPLFYAYKFVNGKCIRSDFVEDLDEIKEEYPYIKNNYYAYVSQDLSLNMSNNKKVRKLSK